MNLPFAQPIWLVAAIIVPLLLALFFWWAERASAARLLRFAGATLLPRLTASHSRAKLWLRLGIMLLATGLLFTALARPQWGADWQKFDTEGVDILFILDVSKSMLAEDIPPNRLERSKLAILDLLEVVRGDRVGLIGFAGTAFLHCPLTLDHGAFRQALNALNTDSIPVGGTNIAAAFDEAKAYFDNATNTRIVILITDGEDLEANGIVRARQLAAAGIRILTVGVGSPDGELIPIRDSAGNIDFLRDERGNPVRTRLDESTLKQIAEIGRGMYAPLGASGVGLRQVYDFIRNEIPSERREESLQRIPIERFQWLLGFACLLLLVEPFLPSRRKAAPTAFKVILFAILLGGIMPADLSANAARQASRAYAAGDFDRALELYQQALLSQPQQPKWLYNAGVAAYRAGNPLLAAQLFQQAIIAGDRSLQAKAFYNAATARITAGFAQLDEDPAATQALWQQALTDLENAIALRGDDYPAAMDNLAALNATFSALTFELALSAVPEQGGSVSGGGRYFSGIAAAISASAQDGWLFLGWHGGEVEDPEAPQTHVTLTADTEIIAVFAKAWDLEVLSADPEMGSAGKSGTYPEGIPVPIEAKAEDYFAFQRWSFEGNLAIEDETAPQTHVTLSGPDARVTAHFVPAFRLSVELEPEIGGFAGPSGFFETYSVVPIRAEPRPGFEWRNWVGAGIRDTQAAESSISMISDRVAIAQFERIWNLVTIPIPEEGGQIQGAGPHAIGATVDLTATPSEGFRFSHWQGDGIADPTQPQTSVTVASDQHDVFAIFIQEDSDQQDQDQNQDQDQDQDQSDQQDSDSSDPSEQQDSNDPADSDPEPDSQPESDQQETESPEPTEPDPADHTTQDEDMQPPQAQLMSPEEALQLLNSLKENERLLPAAPEIDETDPNRPSRTTGRNW